MDPVHFTGKEILEMALRIEENGLKFYSDAAKGAKSKELKDLFKMLADEEGSHIKTFKELRGQLTDEEPSEGFEPYIEDAQLYLKALADTEVFTMPEEGKRVAKAIHNEAEALNLAIMMEKDSILFYYELHRMIRKTDKKVVEALIEQEKTHLKKLTDMMTRLYGG